MVPRSVSAAMALLWLPMSPTSEPTSVTSRRSAMYLIRTFLRSYSERLVVPAEPSAMNASRSSPWSLITAYSWRVLVTCTLGMAFQRTISFMV